MAERKGGCSVHVVVGVGVVLTVGVFGCGTRIDTGSSSETVTSTIKQALTSNGAACFAGADCTSGYCRQGACAPCIEDGNCTPGTLGTAGGQFCGNTGVCTARKPDGAFCNAGSQCSGPGCYAARQCINGCCDNLNFCHGFATGDKACLSGRRCDDGNPCHTGGTVSWTQFPHACVGSANLANGSSCSPDAMTCTMDTCASGLCTHSAGNAGVICRLPSDECDSTTACDGNSITCPAGIKPSGVACMDDANPCTLDRCDGVSASCTHPAGNAGAECRAASGACDVAEVCSGASADCPLDGVAPVGTVCRAPTSSCDPAETCSGFAGYRQTLTLTNAAGGSQRQDFQARLEILADNVAFWNHLDGAGAANGHDLRVQDVAGNDLSIWIEQLDPASKRAWIWVKVPTIPAPPSTTTLRLSYGDPTRAAASNIVATMIFGDEFTGGSIDTSKWIIDDPTGWAVGNGKLTLSNNRGRIHSTTAVTAGMVLETKFQVTNWNHHLAGVMVNGVRNTGDRLGEGIQPGLDLGGRFITFWNKFLWSNLFLWSGDYEAEFARSSIAVVGGSSNRSALTTWSDGSNSRELNFSLSYTPSGAALMLGKRYDDDTDQGTFLATWDWALIRKYASVAPTLVANGDEMVDPVAKNCPLQTAGECGSSCDTCGVACQATNVTRLPLDPGQPFDLANDGARLYWIDKGAGAIKAATIDGGTPSTLVTGLSGLFGLAVDEANVYFGDSVGRSISRIPKSGGVPEIIARQQRMPRFLVSEGDYVFWTNEGTGQNDGSVRRYTKSSGKLESFAEQQPGPMTIASIGGQLSWGDVVAGSVLKRASVTSPVQTVASGLLRPALASGTTSHFVSADGRAYDFDPTAAGIVPRASFASGAFSTAAMASSLFWTNAIRQTVTQQLSPGDHPSTIWRRSGADAPRVIRTRLGVVRFSVSANDPGSIFSFVPEPPGSSSFRTPACPPGETSASCEGAAVAIVPLLECVVETTDHRLIAHFGYTNQDTGPRRIGVGPANRFDREGGDACQPATFAPGTHHDVFAVGFSQELQWIVGARSVTATAASTRCAAGSVHDTEVSP